MAEPATSSGAITADGVVLNKPGRLDSLILIGSGAAVASVILYDNASAAAGTVLARIDLSASQTFDMIHTVDGIICNNGIYADVGGAGLVYAIVHYRPGN